MEKFKNWKTEKSKSNKQMVCKLNQTAQDKWDLVRTLSDEDKQIARKQHAETFLYHSITSKKST